MNTRATELQAYLQNKNIIAFLQMLRHSEGTPTPDGYRMLFGGKLFDSYAAHPQIFFSYTNKAGITIKTSAAGAYQLTYTVWNVLKERLDLPDFSPQSQDVAALELIAEKQALPLITAGKFPEAVALVRQVWASLPGSGNNQPEHSIADVEQWYKDAGGVIYS